MSMEPIRLCAQGIHATNQLDILDLYISFPKIEENDSMTRRTIPLRRLLNHIISLLT